VCRAWVLVGSTSMDFVGRTALIFRMYVGGGCPRVGHMESGCGLIARFRENAP
jgi:hypothetical protein